MDKIKLALMAAGAWCCWSIIGPYVTGALGHIPQTVPRTEQHPTDPPDRRADPQQHEEPDYRVIIGNINATWSDILGSRYRKPLLVLYSGQTSSPCSENGVVRSFMGPAYCPADEKIYVPTSLSRFIHQHSGCSGSPCQFVVAAVVGHEIGHRVQFLLGLAEPAGGAAFELQADCLSGVWAKHEDERLRKEGKPPLVEAGDIEAAMRWQYSIGDDVLMREARKAGLAVDPGRGSHHGTGAQRQQAFQMGWRQGTVAACSGHQ